MTTAHTTKNIIVSRDGYPNSLLLPLAMLFVAMLLISNTIAVKIISIGSFSFPAGILCFPIVYILGDILVEVYGYRTTRIVIWTGLICQVLMASFYYLSAMLEPAPFWTGNDAWTQFFTMSPRIVIGSMFGYFLGGFVNAFLMSRMKLWSGGRHLWIRTIGSTVIGEGIDTIAFSVIAFGGVFTGTQLGLIILSGYILKVSYEIMATPITYWAVGWLKSVEQQDHFDHDIKSYSPFAK